MDTNKWYDLAVKEWERFDKEVRFPIDANDWVSQREIILKHITNIDEMTKEYTNAQNSGSPK